MRPCCSHARRANLPPVRLSYMSSSLYFFSVARNVKFATYLATSTFDSIVLSLSANECVWKTIPFCNNAPVISETIFCLISFVLAHFSKNVPPFRAHNNKSTYRHIVKDVVDSSYMVAECDINLDNNKHVGGLFYLDINVIILKFIWIKKAVAADSKTSLISDWFPSL